MPLGQAQVDMRRREIIHMKPAGCMYAMSELETILDGWVVIPEMQESRASHCKQNSPYIKGEGVLKQGLILKFVNAFSKRNVVNSFRQGHFYIQCTLRL